MYLTENWRLKEQRYTLKGKRTTQTHTITFPPRSVDPRSVEVYQFETLPAEIQTQQVDSVAVVQAVK